MTQAICDITTDEVNVDVVVEPQADTMVEVANRAGGMEQVFHDNTLIGDGNSVDLGVNTDIIATKEYSDEQDTLLRNEINGKLTAIDSQIDANADAIQKTRDDYIQADSEIHQILNNHASELTTLRGNQASLGDQVSGIEEKIPESASGSNPLVTKQQFATKQDRLTAGDNIIISNNVISATGAGGGAGFDMVVVDQLPETGQKGIIYLLAKDGTAPDVYDEYVWITTTQTFELIGTTQVDLTGYVKDTDYASADKAGIIRLSPVLGTGTNVSGFMQALIKSLAEYKTAVDYLFVGKGTLENIKEDLVARAIENAVNTQNLTVGSGEGTLYIGDVAGTATIATNNGLDIVAKTKFDVAPTTDDNTTYANALDVSFVRKAQVATAISDALANIDALPDQSGNAGKVLTTDGSKASWQEPQGGGTKVIIKRYE